MLSADRNPFRSQRADALVYRPTSLTLATLLQRAEATHWRGAIVGPHGTGKSTCLRQLEPLLQQRGLRTHKLNLHAGDAPIHLPDTVVLVDGLERLGFFAMRRWLAASRYAGCLATLHGRGPLPTLLHTQGQLPILLNLVTDLQGELSAPLHARCSELLALHHGNIRECLRTLYEDFADERFPAPAVAPI